MTRPINTLDVCAPIFYRKVPNHAEIKDALLDAIAKMGVHSIEDKSQKISNTDWLLPPSRLRTYIPVVKPAFDEHFKELIACEYSNVQDVIVSQTKYWFQQYKEGDFHDWHMHSGVMFSNVYYLELPEGSARTTFFSLGKEFSVDVEEGSILSFPSTLMHRSAPNKGNRKTVIVANSNLDRQQIGY